MRFRLASSHRPAIAAVLVAALACLLPLTALAAADDLRPLVAGVDYVEIPGGQPFAAQDGQIEVAEIFGYTCPACAHFEPLVAQWKAELADDVAFVPVPAPFGGHWVPYAKAYFAARSLGLADTTHAAMFRALHVEQSLPISRPTDQELAAFYARHGADPEQFIQALNSAEVRDQLAHARAFIIRSFGDARAGTPTLVVAGKYRVKGNSFADMLRIATQLVERERAAIDVPRPSRATGS